MLSTFSRSVPSKVYEAWIFLICFIVNCIMLKSRTPFPCPSTQSINIPLKFHCVFFILNFAIANAVISEKSYFRLSIWFDIINVKREQQGTKNSALGDTRQNWGLVWLYSIYNNPVSEAQKGICPFQYLATDSIAKRFAFKEFMRGCIKSFFFKSNMNMSICPLLSRSLVQSFITIVNWVSQLCPFWMHVAYLTEDYIHQDEPRYLNILCVRVTCKVHKSGKPGDNCTQAICHFSWKGGKYLQETIPLRFHQCQLIAEKMSKYWT